FHLIGKAIDKRTGIGFRGSATWRVRLAPGTYRYGSDQRPRTRRLRVH
ncbi:MAG: hypothetical protein H0W87_05700, partial [Actinobacteria bacterium]|nr:hypothetical protein [Actinomycetota bacterium]